jgi:hypothetical protein
MYSESYLSSEEINLAKSEIRRKLREAEEETLKAMALSLTKSFEITYCNNLYQCV